MESYFENNEDAEVTLKSIAAFAWDIFREINKSKRNQNVFFSPSSINIALAMTYLGARTSTKEQMKNVLKFNVKNEDSIHETFSQLIKVCDTKSRDNAPFTLLNAQRLYAHSGYPFLPEFIEGTKKYYNAELEIVDFKSQAEKARNTINNWVKLQTNEQIPELISDPIDIMTKLILINAVYFKGDWKNKFESDLTYADTFHINSNESVDVDMMFQEEKFLYGESKNINCKVAELPYINDEVSMFIVLPNKSIDIENIEAQIEIKDIINRTSYFRMDKVQLELYLPKFKLEDSLQLKETLSNLGMPEPFQIGSDFSGMDGSRELYLAKAIHKAVIDINEKGSEAAAATSMMMANYCSFLPVEPPKVFKVNRPFLFFIMHRELNMILFLGKVIKP